MKSYAYIRKDYPVVVKEQLKMTQIVRCDDLFIEEANFNETIRLMETLSKLNIGDILVLYTLNSLFLAKNVINIIDQLERKNIRLIALKENIDTEKDELFYSRSLLLLRMIKEAQSVKVQQAIKQIKKQGTILGRPVISAQVIKHIRYLRNHKNYTYREIASECKVSIGTVHKYANSE